MPPTALESSLRYLSWQGYSPTHNKSFSKIPRYFGNIATAILILSILLNFLEVESVEIVAKELHSTMIISQVIVKEIILLYYKNDFEKLFRRMSSFWGVDDKAGSMKSNLIYLLGLERKVARYYWKVTFCSFFVFTLKPFLPGYELPFQCWFPSSNLGFYGVYLIQVIFILHGYIIVIPFDIVFASLCLQVLVQLKLLGYSIANLDVSRGSFEKEGQVEFRLKECFKHHEFLFGILRDIKRIFSLLFFSQIFFTILLMCMDLYISTEDITVIITHAINTVCIILQLFCYCFSAALLSEEADAIAQCLYNCNWYMANTKVRKMIAIAMLRAQKPFNFTAGGLGIVNRETISYAFKTTYSLLTLMKQLKK